MASAAKRAADPKPNPQEWLNVKNDIERLYVVECHNLRYVAHALQHRGFNATLRMFKSRIKEWNFDQKTIRQADWRFMFQEYVRRKKLSTPKETTFQVRQDSRGRVSKYKTIKHIRTYMRRKQVSEDEFLSSPSDIASFPHIRCITPPLSPALSAMSASPSSQVDGYDTSVATPMPWVDVASAVGRGINSSSLQDHTADASRQIYCYQHPSTTSHQDRLNIPHRDSFSSSQATDDRSQECPAILGRRSESLSAKHNSPSSPATTTEMMLQGSQLMAIQTFALDKDNRCGDVEVYRSVARSPSLASSEASETDEAIDLARLFYDLDEDGYDEQDRMNPDNDLKPTDIISAKAQAFKPDVDEARAFRWASMYFLACILQGRMKFALVHAARASATKLFELMLNSETRSPRPFPRLDYVPSHRSRFILSGLTLMATVLKAHGRDDMLKNFLSDSRRSIAQFFRNDAHPLSAPYTYLLALMNNEPIDDEAWEKTLREADRTIFHVWDGGPNAVVSHYYLAWHILKRKRYAEAMGMLKECYEKASHMFGECHILTVNCLSTIARALFEQGKLHDAISCLVDTIKRSQQALGEQHPFCYKLIERVSVIHQELGDFALAEAILRRVVEGRKKSLGLHHGHTSYAVHKLAGVLRHQGKVAESTQLERDLDDEHKEQQFQYYRRKDRYFSDWRELDSRHPSLNIKSLIELH